MKTKTLKFFLPLCTTTVAREPPCGGSELEGGCSCVEFVDGNGIELEILIDAAAAGVLVWRGTMVVDGGSMDGGWISTLSSS